MSAPGRFLLAVVATCGLFLLMRHANQATHASLPSDMPAGSQFVQSGYDVTRNEPTGDWVACRLDEGRDADFCRVTDARGDVVFQGDFLPMRGFEPVSSADLKMGALDAQRLWVQGPSEEGPIPVIALANGKVLVPAADNVALADRWDRDPDERQRVMGY